ncbi:ArsR/SmtB family transcription factor [Spirulina subsalsa]|uniref:ArsR/SmtB family transcription factor n=1 Tax=Spirulina subsalsa TaxID=54311 RepID=UPI0002F86373|nr:metalloregulator ArsR/SmtB family transcription factor [Spirulina subsalsa]
MKSSTTRYAGLLGALGSPVRLFIVRFLVKKYPHEITVAELLERVKISNSAISRHLDKLKQQGIVRVRKDKQYVFYSLNTEVLEDLIAFFYTECCVKQHIVDWQKITQHNEGFVLGQILHKNPQQEDLEAFIPHHIYERLGGKAVQVLLLARMEAMRLKQEKIETEHILLGLLGEGSGGAARALKLAGLDLAQARSFVKSKLEAQKGGIMAFSPMAQQVLQFSLEEAIASGHILIGSEHLLLGVTRLWKQLLPHPEKFCPALVLLTELGIDPPTLEKSLRGA